MLIVGLIQDPDIKHIFCKVAEIPGSPCQYYSLPLLHCYGFSIALVYEKVMWAHRGGSDNVNVCSDGDRRSLHPIVRKLLRRQRMLVPNIKIARTLCTKTRAAPLIGAFRRRTRHCQSTVWSRCVSSIIPSPWPGLFRRPVLKWQDVLHAPVLVRGPHKPKICGSQHLVATG